MHVPSVKGCHESVKAIPDQVWSKLAIPRCRIATVSVDKIFLRSCFAAQCIIPRKANFKQARPDAREGFLNAKSLAGCCSRALDRIGLLRKRLGSVQGAGRTGEGHEFKQNTGLVGSLDAGRPAGYRGTVLDL